MDARETAVVEPHLRGIGCPPLQLVPSIALAGGSRERAGMRRLFLVAMFAAFLAGCGGSEALTNEQVEDMSEQGAIAMLDCQPRKADEDLGEQEEATDRYVEEWMNSAENDGDTLQVILDGDGYSCPEYLS